MSRAAKSGFIAAAVHLMFVSAIAAVVAFPNRTFGGPEAWLYAAFVDLPVYFLLGFVLQAALVLFYWEPAFIAAHDFLFTLLFFAIAGSIQWWLIAYAVSRRRSHARACDENI
jgi:hypothetical protein